MNSSNKQQKLSDELDQVKEELRQERDFQERYNRLSMDIYQNHFTLEEIGRRILELVMSLSQTSRGAVYCHRNGEIQMIAHSCDEPCSHCSLLLLKDQIPGPQTLSLNLQAEDQTNSNYVNGSEDKPVADSQNLCKGIISSFMTARSYLEGRLHGELILVNAEGGFRDIQMGWMEKTVGLFSQAQQREEMRQSLIQARSEAVLAGKSKAQFLANVSHEIRSPLNGVICMASLMEDTELDEEQEELLKIIQFSAESITRIIQDLLELTQISTGKMIIRHESISLKKIIYPLIQNFRKDMEDRDLEFNFEMTQSLDRFTGDPVRIGQIMSNLLNNALKYTEKGSVFLEISGNEAELEITVSDTGIGIPDDKKDKVFDQFVQLDRGRKELRGRKGVGLGLAIVKELLDLMGGSIELRSKLGKGSSFQVKIPSGDRIDLEVGRGVPQAPKKGTVLRVLVAEDDPINMLYLHTLLTRKGFMVDKAENGEVAVNLCKLNKYDLVLMDVSMPQKDGMEATRDIRNFAPDLPILAVTAHAYEGDRQGIMDAGMNGVVLKPIDENELLNAVSDLSP